MFFDVVEDAQYGQFRQRRSVMHLKYVFAALLIAWFATPALADYWVVQDTTTKKCTVVKEKPTTSTTVSILGGTVTYKTEDEAMGYIKKTKICTTN
jgi:hypothetical protein